ncbi:TetR/AcrR family transcriptional regulator [Sulfurimonas sp.]|uniref:TetR/AcrR family transcriptional regulator n=1 Tax=Sulfurimonas sp. TaxID=2022749 RepID=UPI002634B3D5|nr:TetR/AcrR family transcriptional regulator [Sulfurimonas sp.]
MSKEKKKNSILLASLEIFTKQGFYKTTISQIAKHIGISVGNVYNYFPSKESLAKASIVFVTEKLATILHNINAQDIPAKEKVACFVEEYLEFLQKHPEMIEYFFRIYLANREVFYQSDDSGFSLAESFIKELEKLVTDGIASKEFANQDFYISFACISGILGGITFLHGEKVLQADLAQYKKNLAHAICKSLS